MSRCRSSLFVISAVIVTDIYVHSLVELKIIRLVVLFNVSCVKMFLTEPSLQAFLSLLLPYKHGPGFMSV